MDRRVKTWCLACQEPGVKLAINHVQCRALALATKKEVRVIEIRVNACVEPVVVVIGMRGVTIVWVWAGVTKCLVVGVVGEGGGHGGAT